MQYLHRKSVQRDNIILRLKLIDMFLKHNLFDIRIHTTILYGVNGKSIRMVKISRIKYIVQY